MSDGPHRSLPMSRTWKRVAERAANSASAESESEDALRDALLKEIAPLLPKLREVVLGDGQMHLFNDKMIAALETLHEDFAGSAVACMCIDATLAACLNGEAAPDALVMGLEEGAYAYTHAQFRGIGEHYVRSLQERKTKGSVVRTLRERVARLSRGFNFRSLARDMCDGKSLRRRSTTKQSGTDQGPPL